VRSTRFLLPLARYRETDRRMDGQDGHWLRHPSHGDAGSSCFHTLKGMAGRGGCVCRRRVCSPVAYLGPETGRSRKDRAIVLLAALAMDGGSHCSVALRATPWAWLVREPSGVVIGLGGQRPTGEQMHSLHARQTQFPTQPARFNFGEKSLFCPLPAADPFASISSSLQLSQRFRKVGVGRYLSII
jgi:hypothetical protein